MITNLVNMCVLIYYRYAWLLCVLSVINRRSNICGQQSWTFRHPDFHAERRDSLENIKRKVPTQRKPIPAGSSTNPNPTTTTTSTTAGPTTSASPNAPNAAPASSSSPNTTDLQSQIDQLTRTQEDLTTHIRNLERNYQDVLVEMVNFQRNMAQQDGLMQNLIQYFLQVENGELGC
jgi:osomolarity two-component system response regulator SKN7